MFPRLAERKGNGGAQLSGGEQQMLAIGRALLLNPQLLVMDEPTEGLAPVIVEQVAQALRDAGRRGRDRGAADRAEPRRRDRRGRPHRRDGQRPHRAARCRRRELGRRPRAAAAPARRALGRRRRGGRRRRRRRRADEPRRRRCSRCAARHGDGDARVDDLAPRTVRGFTRWNAGGTRGAAWPTSLRAAPAAGAATAQPRSRRQPAAACSTSRSRPAAAAPPMSPAPSTPRAASCSSCASAWRSSACARSRSTSSTSGKPSPASVHPREVARHHPQGEAAVFTGDRGSAVARDGAGLRALHRARGATSAASSRAGGSGGTALATPAMRALPIGVPEGDGVDRGLAATCRPYVGPERHLHDVFGHRRVRASTASREQVLANAAHALAGMIAHAARPSPTQHQAGASA